MSEVAKAELRKVEDYTKWLDTKFKIPGTDIRFGLDFIIGLIPFGGHIITFIFSSLLINTMAKHKVSSYVIAKMIFNVLLDTIVGSIPILGNIFDIWFKANLRNYRMLQEHYGEGKYQGSYKKVLIPVLIAILIIVILLIWLVFEIIDEIFEFLF